MIEELNIDPPDDEVIGAIEKLLDSAKKGEIQSIAYICSHPGRYVSNGWSGMNKNNMAIIGELRVLERDIMDLLIDIRVDPETGEINF